MRDSQGAAPADPVETVLHASIRDIGIPPRPAILQRIQHEMQQDLPDFQRLAGYISADVSLSAGLMKTANSPYFGFRNRARTVPQALMMLGLDVASRAVAGLILRQVFAAVPRLERFWDASARIARVAGWLAQQHGARDGVRAEEAYTFALFRDCGIPILMRRYPAYWDTLREANAEPLRSFTEVEEARWPTTHSIVGCVLAQSWWMPHETCLAIRHHHDADALAPQGAGLPPATRRMIALAHLAEHCVQAATGASATREWEKLGAAATGCLALDAGELDTLVAAAAPVATAALD